MKRLLFITCLFLASHALYAQYNLKENNQWAFGTNAGLDFNSGVATPIKTGIDAYEGCASICDSSGQLLFYCTGDTIWNKNGQPMPNGQNVIEAALIASSALAGSDTAHYSDFTALSTTQGTVIVPVLDNKNQYYVFSLSSAWAAVLGEPNLAGRLYYSIVDMSLNNGLGDVVSNRRGILMDSALTEKMTVVAGDNCNIWLLVHSLSGNMFKAYEITSSGVAQTPITSVSELITGIWVNWQGEMKISPNRRKLVLANPFTSVYSVELFDFDPATGIVNNPIILDSSQNSSYYYTCFSPDGSKVYISGYTGIRSGNQIQDIAQFSINAPTTAAIINSKTEIYTRGPNGMGFSLKLGPDGKLYSAWINTDSVSVIEFPNLAGTACHYIPNVCKLLNSNYVQIIDLPNDYVKPLQDTIRTHIDTILSATGHLVLKIPAGYFSYLWNDGTIDSGKVVQDTGTYWVTYSNYCTYRTDTFVVRAATAVAQLNGKSAASITVYPSPAQTIATITINGIAKVNGTLRIIDAVGRIVLEQTCTDSKQMIPVGSMTAGVYTVEYIDNALPLQMQQRLVITQ